jgi:hypothetical protein
VCCVGQGKIELILVRVLEFYLCCARVGCSDIRELFLTNLGGRKALVLYEVILVSFRLCFSQQL